MRPRLLFHCQHSLGLGHLVRSLALARALAERFDVVLLAGGELPPDLALPAELDVVPLRAAPGDDARIATVLNTFRTVRPDAVVVELFPFGRKKLAGELLPMLAEARAAGAVVASSVRDILVRGRSDQPDHDERARATADRLFDVVLVHADPRLLRLDETFRPRRPLRVPVRYTGFVVPDSKSAADGGRGDTVVVSAGGGRFGAPLLRAALAAAPALRAAHGLRVKLAAGPFFAEAELRELQRDVRRDRGVELVRSVPDLAAELGRAAVSVSQCGYNTALDVVRARVPAVVVPFEAPGEDEQARRASVLAELGLVRVVREAQLTPEALVGAVRAVAGTEPPSASLDLGGAARTRDLLADAVARRQRGAA